MRRPAGPAALREIRSWKAPGHSAHLGLLSCPEVRGPRRLGRRGPLRASVPLCSRNHAYFVPGGGEGAADASLVRRVSLFS